MTGSAFRKRDVIPLFCLTLLVLASMVINGIKILPNAMLRLSSLTFEEIKENVLLSGEPMSDYAYAFLLAGCDPSSPSYKGFLYNILVAAEVLVESTYADLVILIQMGPNSTESTLPEEKMLVDYGFRIMYLEKPLPDTQQSFSDLNMLKFHILRLTEYKRIIFLDADVMPVCNVDYVFDLAIADGTENVVVAWTGEPAWGAFFMITPRPGEYNQIEALIQEYMYPFDRTIGWGHALIDTPDYWLNIRETQSQAWDFYGGDADQGLLYHWVKYVKQNVLIIIGGKRAQKWESINNTVALAWETTPQQLYSNFSCFKDIPYHLTGFAAHPAYGRNFLNNPPYSDLVHFYARFKPWSGRAEPDGESRDAMTSAKQYWFHLLRKVDARLNMSIDFASWEQEPPDYLTR